MLRAGLLHMPGPVLVHLHRLRVLIQRKRKQGMSYIDNSIVFKRTYPTHYPWVKWLDGNTHVLIRGDDFDVPVKNFASQAGSYGRAHGIKIEVMTLDAKRLAIRAVKDEVKPDPTRTAGAQPGTRAGASGSASGFRTAGESGAEVMVR